MEIFLNLATRKPRKHIFQPLWKHFNPLAKLIQEKNPYGHIWTIAKNVQQCDKGTWNYIRCEHGEEHHSAII